MNDLFPMFKFNARGPTWYLIFIGAFGLIVNVIALLWIVFGMAYFVAKGWHAA